MIYYLYQISKDKKQSQLTRWEMVEVLKKQTDLSDWLYWTIHEKNWIPAKDSAELRSWIQMSESFLESPPPLPEKLKSEPLIVSSEQGLLIDNLKSDFEVIESEELVKKPTIELRKFPRVHGRLRTILTNKHKAFITYSVNISLGGVQVEHDIPTEILRGDLEIYLSDPLGKKSLLINCQVVGDKENSKRFSFSGLEKEQSKKLVYWIEQLTHKQTSRVG
jgi:hypothetical protein